MSFCFDPTFTHYDLINNFKITFVLGAIYKDEDGNFFECCNTGNIYPKQEKDLIEFIKFRDEVDS